MSERELRAFADTVLADSVYGTLMGRCCQFCQASTERRHDELVHEAGCLGEGLKQALDDDPDVVEVLRWLKERAAWGDKVEAEGTQARDGNIEIAGRLSAMECRFMANELSKRFHVRFTDDGGYEWTE